MACKDISGIGLASIAAMVIMTALPAAAALDASLSDLQNLISSFDDSHMDAQDLAYYLATHGFDARPVGGYVEVNLGGSICKLTPNGIEPGLANFEA